MNFTDDHGTSTADMRLPGDMLRNVLEKQGLTQRELALRTGRPFKTISEIMNGKTRITPETAIQLENVLRVPAGFWIDAEGRYREYQARKEEADELKSQIGQLENYPLSALHRRGFISETEHNTDLVKEVIGFYGVNALAQIEEIYNGDNVHFRRPIEEAGKPRHLAAWLREGEVLANNIPAPPYEEETFKQNLHKIRNLNENEPEVSIKDVYEICKEAGVILLYVPKYPGGHVDILARWLCPDKALVQFGIPFQSELEFCSVLFHEAVHLIRHSKKKIYADLYRGEHETEDEFTMDELDREADRVARNLLVPDEEYDRIQSDKPITQQKILSTAQYLDVSPGLIVSRLQKEHKIPRYWMNYLKKKVVDWDLLSDPLSPTNS
ncbi:MAG: helix-turn-helix domain-containing protein [Balneolaceae bacterium]